MLPAIETSTTREHAGKTRNRTGLVRCKGGTFPSSVPAAVVAMKPVQFFELVESGQFSGFGRHRAQQVPVIFPSNTVANGFCGRIYFRLSWYSLTLRKLRIILTYAFYLPRDYPQGSFRVVRG
jgi:hypothetical protein